MTKEMRPNQWYKITNKRTGSEYWPPEGRVWRFQPSTMEHHIDEENIIWPDDEANSRMSRPRFKTRFDPEAIDATTPVSTWINTRQNGNSDDDEGDERVWLAAGMNQDGTKELRDLFGEQVMEYPKPLSLLKALLSTATRGDDLILDFFAGSCTTAHAALQLNRVDGGSRRTVMVQLPEPTDAESTAKRAGYATIADIGKERMRRAIQRLTNEANGSIDLTDRATPEDLGFRVFKLDECNYRRWTGTEEKDTDDLSKQMELFDDPLLPDWEPTNVIYEVLLKEGYGLTSRIEKLGKKNGGPNTVFRVAKWSRQPGLHPVIVGSNPTAAFWRERLPSGF